MDKELLQTLKKMAMADGVLSENEKKLFREIIPMSDEDADSLFSEIESELECVQSETEVIDWKKKNGTDFERFIVSRLLDCYTIVSWSGDKYIDGKYDARNLDPDIIIDIKSSSRTERIAIECKFHMGFVNGLLFVAKEEQLERYKQYQKNNHIPTFIAIGVGGSGANPESLYLVPVFALKYRYATMVYLEQFKLNPSKKLYYSLEDKSFRK